MPELPDVEIYCESLTRFYAGRNVERASLRSPFLVRTIEPELFVIEGRRILGFSRLGKRIVWEFDGELFLVLHLMIAGRLRWKEAGARMPAKVGLLALDFSHGTLILTEAGTKRQASLFVVSGRDALQQYDPGGINVLDADLAAFAQALRHDNHTLKRALTDPHLFSGIGNAYSDEILLAARLSPFKQTGSLSGEETRLLFEATRVTLAKWIDQLQQETGDGFPEKVTAFREGMAVHGRFGRPCPDCGSPVQRIVYASNESNYCATCQTGGRLLADRALSRLLREDWPRSLEDLEGRRKG